MRFSPRDRVMVLAPHPDDETLGAGGLLQRAAGAGASSRVVFVTDGDDNPWPQRIVERRVWLGPDARARWGARRRSEAYAALDALGVGRRCGVFLGCPDQGMTRLLVRSPDEVIRRLRAEICEWRPTVIVMPSLRDCHPDHNALAVLALETLAALPHDERPIALTYVVHPLSARRDRDDLRLHLTADEQARKHAAIECHATQLVFHSRSYRRIASSVESFAMASARAGAGVRPLVEEAVIDGSMLRIRISLSRLRARGGVLLVVGWAAPTLHHLALRLEPHAARRRIEVRDLQSEASFGVAYRASYGGRAQVVVPVPRATMIARFFVKSTSRVHVLDRDGWIEGVVQRQQCDVPQPDAGRDGFVERGDFVPLSARGSTFAL